WLVLGLLPFDITIRPAELAQKFRAGRIHVTPLYGGPRAASQVIVSTALLAARPPGGRLVGRRAERCGRHRRPGTLPGVHLLQDGQHGRCDWRGDWSFCWSSAGVAPVPQRAGRVLDVSRAAMASA